MLTNDQWEQWLHEHLRPALMDVGFNARSIFNEDKPALYMNLTPASGGRKVFALHGSKSVVRRAGYNHTHVPCMAAVAGDGSQIPPPLLFKEQRIARCWSNKAKICLFLRATGTGCWSAERFADGIQHVFLREVTSSDRPIGKVLLVLDGSRTQYKPELLYMCTSKCVKILPLPPKYTDILQPCQQSRLSQSKKGFFAT